MLDWAIKRQSKVKLQLKKRCHWCGLLRQIIITLRKQRGSESLLITALANREGKHVKALNVSATNSEY